jgi:hypothetical protein
MDGHTRLTLLLARLLVTDPASWTSGVLARDPDGRPVPALDESAASWCARGAIYRVVDGDPEAFRRAARALDASSRALYGEPIRSVNDSGSPFAHEAVLGAFDHAVDALALARHVLSLAGRPLPPGTDVLGLREPKRGRATRPSAPTGERGRGPRPADQAVAPAPAH